MHSVAQYREAFTSYLESRIVIKEPQNLYEPIRYILGLGGKRLRPVLTLIGSQIFGGDYRKAMDVALAVEVFHNFSLVHDDIMDDAPLRRGKPTVHEKWDINAGILSGDAMLILAYQLFESVETSCYRNLVKVFSQTAMEVCEGQQYDVDFETRDDVSIAEYLKMIEFKTAVLIGAALQMGAIVAGASLKDQQGIYEFGRNLGLAFQLKDDYLDAFGDPETFGKQVGGDIIENKKTYLYLKALELGDSHQRRELNDLFSMHPEDPSDKIAATKEIFIQSGSAQCAEEAIQNYTQNAFDSLEKLTITMDNKNLLRAVGTNLMQRIV